ncbi:Oxygen-independent coproporphyrinogen III oxidase [Sinobacterium norvegicum]|uniref:Coproporphyrinogen-III oxidase n=1 Tax=Sinobacterium norvegicum TaxID=1641715 RepID=A0ABN8EGL4_9GAMM|nr:oxygen-independent coproporphyrinogen III oxidase [Sinobacterium norvegicum]CAH0990835.1 Oxygen-independent coproporphyrinogen III oxidase [Sinobacterium norvegicum]
MPETQTNITPTWDSELIKKYDVSGPRYTSYPTANLFGSQFQHQQYVSIAEQDSDNIAPISLYIHIPFCENICYYCACNKVVTRDRSKSREYLGYLEQEIALRGKLHGKRPVTQLHFGGGTPTFLAPAELTELMVMLGRHFNLSDSDSREYSIELDPRTIDHDYIALLKGLGFNRVSLGIQDFHPPVQKAINREQSVEMVSDLIDTLRNNKFDSISFDLIYGLPHQSVSSFSETLATVIKLNPDRLSIYNYAHLPDRFKTQRSIDRLTLPTAQEKLEIMAHIGTTLDQAGYDYIGMDHFVKPDDELAKARKNKRLQRNFQGYSTCLATDLIGLGVSSITSLSDTYSQNEKDLTKYYELVKTGQLPIVKGYPLTVKNTLHREIIMSLACQLELDIVAIEQQFDIDLKQLFSNQWPQLLEFEADGLISLSDKQLVVSDKGRLFLRQLCMVFDEYLNIGDGTRFSKTL